jgi:hypothetical protein
MIISHKHKFIFIKCGKVAGTSVEVALRKVLGDEDISTPVARYDEEYAEKNDYPSPCNYRNSNFYDNRVRKFSSKGLFYEHAFAYEIKGLIGDETWDGYYTFCIDRDPRDKSLSSYYHHRYGIKYGIGTTIKDMANKYIRGYDDTRYPKRSIAKISSLTDWLHMDRQYAFAENWARYTLNDKSIVDKVYNFSKLESLVSDLSDITSSKIVLPQLKSQFRKHNQISKNEENLRNKLLENPIYSKEYDLLNKN